VEVFSTRPVFVSQIWAISNRRNGTVCICLSHAVSHHESSLYFPQDLSSPAHDLPCGAPGPWSQKRPGSEAPHLEPLELISSSDLFKDTLNALPSRVSFNFNLFIVVLPQCLTNSGRQMTISRQFCRFESLNVAARPFAKSSSTFRAALVKASPSRSRGC
jgi:hypothetical protein